MLISLMMSPFWTLVLFLITLLPPLDYTPTSIDTVVKLAGYSTAILGQGFTAFVLGNIVFWLTVQLSWAIIEWVYKKVPGIK